ncbi:hypothetical protein [Serratia ficaria]|uniref:hypothetical protein n=1 Tax=Serratia ficaria TaxID=61651 RepID=UPI00217B7DA9|nr:hypothetical protein [Serratia ficaria]CAI1832273.1 Uncharacterised protein [Serratia ficaria]CAI2420343.1 Uncharacterised protein [Serratia ficaria]
MDFIEEFDVAIRLGVKGNIEGTLLNADSDYVFELAETLYLITCYHFRFDGKPNENFSFVANSSLSGGRHPCSAPGCRIDKLDQLISFSSLYSDEVYIQNPFEEIVTSGVDNLCLASRQELVAGIYNYLYLRPLIKRGIIKYAQNMVSLCHDHHISLAEPLREKIINKENQLYNLLHDFLLETCEVALDMTDTNKPFFEIKGSTSIIDHGTMYFYLLEPLGEYIEHLCSKVMPYKFTKKEVIDEGILRLVIDPIIKDLSDQEWHSAFYGTSYLCDNQIQMDIASKLNSAVYKANSTSFGSAVNHYLPTIQSKSTDDILALRDKEAEAFHVYRDKINTLIKKGGGWSEREISELFRDQILPEINIIEKKVRDWKTKTRSGLRDKIIIGSGAISFGLYSGMLPHDFSHLFAAAGGGAALVSAAIDLSKTLKGKEEARSNDFYFLWHVNK